MLNNKSILIALFLGLTQIVQSQIKLGGKVDIGYLKFSQRTIDVDPGPNWQGYYLNNNQNGIDFNLTGGVLFGEKVLTGIGIGYLNFEGINGFSVFTDIEYLPISKKFAPLLNLKIGYSHIRNQYPNGTGTGLMELLCGVNYKLTDRTSIYLKTGFTATQWSLLIPIKIGLRI